VIVDKLANGRESQVVGSQTIFGGWHLQALTFELGGV
jgi:hypothetical protein